VEKYVMSDEEYAKRDNTYRAFKQKQLAADPNWKPVHAQTNVVQQARRAVEGVVEESEQEIRARIQVGQRCSVFPGDRRGEVRIWRLLCGGSALVWVFDFRSIRSCTWV
jgi:tubulin-folding cofactor B